MPLFTEKRLDELRAIIAPYVEDGERLTRLMQDIRGGLRLDEEMERVRARRQAHTQRVRDANGGSTYTASDRAYYEARKEELIPQMVASQRERRARARQPPATPAPESDDAE